MLGLKEVLLYFGLPTLIVDIQVLLSSFREYKTIQVDTEVSFHLPEGTNIKHEISNGTVCK